MVMSKPSALYRVLNEDVEDGKFSKAYVQRHYGIERLLAVSIEDLVGDLNETVPNYSYLPGTSLTIDIALLMAIARRFDDCQYLEIGSWRGESLSAVASVAEHCTSITLGKNEMEQIGLSKEQIDLHGFYTKKLLNVTEIYADSTQYNFEPLKGKFDLIFIDGSHKKADIESDTRNAFSLLRNDKGIIVWHDYGWDTERVRYNTLAGILDGLPSQIDRKHIYHVAQTKCAIYWPSSINTFMLKRHGKPQHNFRVTVTREKH
jgi:predicted O-methyltransferase YrrM